MKQNRPNRPVHRTIMRISKDKENPYVMINREAMQDDRMSWKARGILGYLLSLPDDWTIYLSELEGHSTKDGRESLASGIKELMELGYIIREQSRSDKGTFVAYNYTVFESPQTPQEPDFQTVNGKPDNGQFTANGLSDSGEPATTNTHNTNTHLEDEEEKIKNKKIELPEATTEIPQEIIKEATTEDPAETFPTFTKNQLKIMQKVGATEADLEAALEKLDSEPDVKNPVAWLQTALENEVLNRELAARPKTPKAPKTPKESKPRSRRSDRSDRNNTTAQPKPKSDKYEKFYL